MTDPLSRDYLLKRMDELLPAGYKDAPPEHVETLIKRRAETLQWAETATDDQLSDWIGETELSQAFWEKWDRDVAADLAKMGEG